MLELHVEPSMWESNCLTKIYDTRDFLLFILSHLTESSEFLDEFALPTLKMIAK